MLEPTGAGFPDYTALEHYALLREIAEIRMSEKTACGHLKWLSDYEYGSPAYYAAARRHGQLRYMLSTALLAL